MYNAGRVVYGRIPAAIFVSFLDYVPIMHLRLNDTKGGTTKTVPAPWSYFLFPGVLVGPKGRSVKRNVVDVACPWLSARK